MTVKIDKKITGYALVNEQDKKDAAAKAAELSELNAKVVQIGEPLDRPEKITGSTYKVKTPVTEHALYITINDVVMNEGTPQAVSYTHLKHG